MSNIVEFNTDDLYWIEIYISDIKKLLQDVTLPYKTCLDILDKFNAIEMHVRFIKEGKDK